MTTGVRKKFLKCTYCHKDGHLKKTCYRLIGYSPKDKGKGKITTGTRNLPQAMQVTGSLGSTVQSDNSATSKASHNQQQQQATIDQLQ